MFGFRHKGREGHSSPANGREGHSSPNHFVYLILAQSNGYVGRTGGKRALGNNSLPGIAPRWSEHVRELEVHRNGPVYRKRRRRRYDSLKYGGTVASILLSICLPLLKKLREQRQLQSLSPKPVQMDTNSRLLTAAAILEEGNLTTDHAPVVAVGGR